MRQRWEMQRWRGRRSARRLRIRNRGAALIVVLWIVTLLALMAASFSLGVRREATLGEALIREVEMEAAIRAAVAYAFYRLHLPDPTERWYPYGRSYPFRFDGVELTLTISDESGKLNLNRLRTPEPLRAILEAAGLDGDRARSLADAILDWVDPDDLRRPFGAERRDYEEAGLPYGPANAPFRSLDEVAMVLGMTPHLFQRLLPWVTVYGLGATLNPWAAPESLLRRLPGVDPRTLDLFLQQRRSWQPETPLPQPPPIPYLVFSQAQRGIVSFDITARKGEAKRRIYLTARLDGIQIQFLEWWPLPLEASSRSGREARPR